MFFYPFLQFNPNFPGIRALNSFGKYPLNPFNASKIFRPLDFCLRGAFPPIGIGGFDGFVFSFFRLSVLFFVLFFLCNPILTLSVLFLFFRHLFSQTTHHSDLGQNPPRVAGEHPLAPDATTLPPRPCSRGKAIASPPPHRRRAATYSKKSISVSWPSSFHVSPHFSTVWANQSAQAGSPMSLYPSPAPVRTVFPKFLFFFPHNAHRGATCNPAHRALAP